MLAHVLNPANYLATAHAVGPWVVGILIAGLGIAVLARERASKVSSAFCLLTMSVAIWLLSVGGVYSALRESVALWWVKAEHLGVAFIPSTLFLLALILVQRLHQFRFFAWGSLILSSLFYFAVIFTDQFVVGLYQYSWGFYARYGGPLSYLFLIFFISLLFGTLGILKTELVRCPPGIPRQRIKALLIALLVAYVGLVDYLGAFGIPVYPFGYVPIFVFVVIMTIAVWRYRFVEITPAVAAEQIIQTMADALLVSDHEGTIRVANLAASRLFGRRTVEFLGQSVTSVLGEHITPQKLSLLAHTGTAREHEIRFSNTQGKVLILDVEASVTQDRSGRPLAFIFIIRDVTEHKRLEEQLHQAQKLEAVGSLAREIAQEVDTSLRTISRHGAMLAGHQDKDPGVRYAAKKIKEATDRINALKNELLSLGSSDHVRPMPLDLNGLVTNLYGVLEWVLGEHFELRLRFDAALGLVKADVSQIRQVIIKLVALIRDLLPQGGKLTIETANVHLTEISFHTPGLARPGDYVMVAVSAQAWILGEEPRGHLRWVAQWLSSERIEGEGIRGHLFEPFAAGGERGRATWLGLVMAYAIVKRAGGEIVVESEIDRGTTLRMYLPLAGSCALTRTLH